MNIDEALRDRVGQKVHEIVGVDIGRDDVDMIETGRLDSLGLVELILALERDFRVMIPLETLEIENFRTVGSITRLVEDLQVVVVSVGAQPAPS